MKITNTTPCRQLRTLARLALVGFTLLGLALTPLRAMATGLAQAGSTAQPASMTPDGTTSEAPAGDISWLAHANSINELASDQSLAGLAGKLIFDGLVDASSCEDGGLLRNGYASPCGERVARPAVILWQNQFDEAILQAANQYEIPPYLLKNVIARETQFWPARHLTIYGYYEFGLGHITQMGADSLLRWNQVFYQSFCGQVFSVETCKTPYGWMPADQQATLRGAVLQIISADCEGCTAGVDLQRARASIPVIAAVIKANLNHLEWLLKGFTSSTPNKSFENSDLWRLTVASYNAGPGCITTAAGSAVAQHFKLNWKNISAQFDDGCKAAIGYVDAVSAFYPAGPDALAAAQRDTSKAAVLVYTGLGISMPTPTPTETATPAAPQVTATASVTPEDSNATPEAGTNTPTPEITASGTFEATTPSSTPAVTETNPGSPTPTGTAQPTTSAAPISTEASSEVVVNFKALVPQFVADAVIKAAGGEVSEQIDALKLTVVKTAPGMVTGVLDALQNNLLVNYAEPNYSGQVLYTPNDPGFAGQSSLLDLHVPPAWDLTQGEGVVVAVIDTGIDATHPDLAANLWVNPGETGLDANGNDKRTNGIDDDHDGKVDDWQGWNFINNSNDISDLNGHGTHSAGIIAARVDNNLGIAGVAPLAKLMVLKAVNDSGNGTYADVASAIIYAVDHGAKVINLGFGGTDKSATLEAATDYAYSQGVSVVAAAGNSGTNQVYYPAGDSNVIAVSALDSSLYLAPFSSYGDTINIAAPGVSIYSTLPGEKYGQLSGTSMAAAQVSGIAALLASQGRFDTPDAIRSALDGSALDLGSTGKDNYFGYGLAQAYEALSSSLLPVAMTATPTQSSSSQATPTEPASGVHIMGSVETFWASTQISSNTINNPTNSIFTSPAWIASFDSLWANSSGRFGANKGWLISDLARTSTSSVTTFTSIYSTNLDIRFYITGWADDTWAIQISPDNSTTWITLETFDSTNPPPSTVDIARSYNVSNYVNTPTQVNAFQVRIWNTATAGQIDNVTIYLDQASLTVTQNTPPTLTITSPGSGTSSVLGRLLSFNATATDNEEGALTGKIQWFEGTTLLGAGGSFTTTTLPVGVHTITATVSDNRGLSTSASVTVTVVANTPPLVSINSPTNGSTYAHGAAITFTGLATDTQDGNISANLTWSSNIDGPIGKGASFSNTGLTPATHIITATVTDLDGATNSATVTITIQPDNGPHGSFNGSTEGCALCHRSHSAQSAGGDLLAVSNSAFVDNTFCLNCHGSGSSAISTHSNIDAKGTKEAKFELLCVQCHDPHGGTGNLFGLRSFLQLGAIPTNFTGMTTLGTPVVFSALTGNGSFDNTGNANSLCVACHQDASDPGAPMTIHNGGANHIGGFNYQGLSCISCHPHNADAQSATRDGFMPVRGSCIGCHSISQPKAKGGTLRAIVGAGNDFSRASHHVSGSVTDNDCMLCHDQSQHMSGTVRLLNVDNPATVYALDGTNDTVNYNNFCLSCHDTNGAKGDTSPFSDNVNMAGTSLQMNQSVWTSASHNESKTGYSGSCKECHDNGHGSNKVKLLAPYSYVSTGSPVDDPMKQDEYFCYGCHKAGGVAKADIMTNYTKPTVWVQLPAGENGLTTLNDRHDISTTDQSTGAIHSGAKIECTSCHNPHTDSPALKVIADPDPTDGRVPGTKYFTQGSSSTDFWSDWCLDCHDGSYPPGVTPPTNPLVNLYNSMSVNTHGAGSGNVTTLNSSSGYTTNTIVQCRQCHGIHVQAPTKVTGTSNLFSALTVIRNASNTADLPTTGGTFNYEITNNSNTSTTTSGYNFCNTCHTGSMGANKTNCFQCHYHGASGKW